ncbi:Zn-dependent hydrolase [Alteromonas sp. V450]|uniref:MBL fold metallo-hydrolase n=1 Tax=Alteromonas sp. V450 TaxID=1912139 RepID=UPI0008FF5C38|nr:MBL fold metallo-hydrolase [Alteromonas sp. V450]OJF70006.1 Zn-dependent hydrolase [Alteromonas sp. V450]
MKIHTLSGYIQHIYLVEDTSGILLLDGCSRADVDEVCRYITQTLGRPLSHLKLITVTHMHPDHAGGAMLLRQRSGAQVASHPKASQWYRGVMGRIAHSIDILLTWYVAGRIGKPRKPVWYNPVLAPDILLKGKQRLPGFADWQVLYTPGHTDHDLSLVHTPTQQAYIADVLVQVKGELVPPYPLCHPNQYRQTLNMLANSQIDTFFCAHVPPTKKDDIDFAHVVENAPRKPKNHWHSSKNRIKKKLFGLTKEH